MIGYLLWRIVKKIKPNLWTSPYTYDTTWPIFHTPLLTVFFCVHSPERGIGKNNKEGKEEEEEEEEVFPIVRSLMLHFAYLSFFTENLFSKML